MVATRELIATLQEELRNPPAPPPYWGSEPRTPAQLRQEARARQVARREAILNAKANLAGDRVWMASVGADHQGIARDARALARAKRRFAKARHALRASDRGSAGGRSRSNARG